MSQPVSLAALRWNALGASVGSLVVFILLPLLTGDFLFLSISLVLIAAIVCLIWVAAPRFETAPAQIRFNAILISLVLNSAGILLLMRWDHWMSIRPTQPEVPGWALAVGVWAFGILLAWVLFRRASRAESKLEGQ
jgi:hypothetical protein